MSDITTIEPGTRAQFVTIGRDELNAMKAELSAMRDDCTAEGELLGASMERVGTLERELAEATALNATLRNDLAIAIQSLAIERRNVQRLADQLESAHDESSDLHAELSKVRRANVAILPGDGFASEKQQDTRPAIEQRAYPDAGLAREAGVSELRGEGESE